MATSQEFQNLLRSGKIADAMTLALSEMIELKIRTRVVPADADGAAGDLPGYQMQTRINIVDGDIDNEVGSLFLKEGPYSELRSFHTQQVVQAQEIIRTNIESLQALLGILIQGVSQTSTKSASPGFSEPTPIVSDATPEDVGMGVGLMGITAVAATGATLAGFSAGFSNVSPAEAAPESFVDFSSFSATEVAAPESLEPIAFSADALEPDRFSALVDGGADDGDYLSDSEAIEAPLEELAAVAVEPILGETEPSLDFEALEEPEIDFSGGEETAFDFSGEPEATLDFGAIEAPEMEVSAEETVFDFSEEPEAALDFGAIEAPEMEVSGEEPEAFLDFDTPEEASLDFSTSAEEKVFDLSGDTLDEDVVAPEASTDPLVSDSSDATPEWSIEDSVNLGEEMPMPVDEMPVSEMPVSEMPIGEMPVDEMTGDDLLVDKWVEDTIEDDDLNFLDFEEPNDFDIPADLPDPLADLQFVGSFIPPDFLMDTVPSSESETIDFGFDPEENLESEPAYDFGRGKEVTFDEGDSFGDNILDPIAEDPISFDSEDWDLGQEEASGAIESIGEELSPEELSPEELSPEDSALGLSVEESTDFATDFESDFDTDFRNDWAEEPETDIPSVIPEVLGDTLQFGDDEDFSLELSDDDSLSEALDAIDDFGDLEEMDDFETGLWDEAQAGTPIAESGLSQEEDWNDAANAMGGLDNLDDLDDFEDMVLLPGELPETGISLDTQDPHFGEAMGVADVDAMDSLFQNSANNLDLGDFQTPDFSAQATSDLDPFDLEMDDPFEEVLDLEEDPFASLSMDDTPPLPPPPPRPRRSSLNPPLALTQPSPNPNLLGV